jgi:alkanesulfonate monooxygenase SsuD/methylene tetrahydromethanopterin reductase-like flavin-dependent oxidoreductase (luciferase family)
MTDYRRRIAFGIFPVPNAADLDTIFEAARMADEGGLDLIGIQDHPYQRRYVDTYALMTALLMRTTRITVFPDVTSLPLRPPGVLAKAAASLDLLSDGRFELGLGAGSFWDAVVAIGGPRRTQGDARRALSEAIDIIRIMWGDERLGRYEGDYYQLAGVRPGPKPAHDIGIWLGVYGPRSLQLLGEKADGWIPSLPSMPIDQLDSKHAQIDEAALAAGREPGDIRRLANVNGVITDGATDAFLHGPRDQWVDELTSLALDHGIDSFVLWPEGDLVDQTAKYAEIAEATREAIVRARGV